MVFFIQSKGHVCKSLVKARKPWLLLVIKKVVRHIFPACFGKICAASGVHCQSSADTAKRIEISSSQGLKKPPKMSPREEKAYLPRAAGPREVSFFFPRAYFKVFYNPRDEEISIPDINGHSENLFLFEFIYVQNLFFSVKSSFSLATREEMVISKWPVGIRYRNFFIPRVVKNL